uniref:Retrotransposon gag domain-containing protein n=1 Tax=Cannabis sativa TaxID=3483 RepID=A0A803PYS9_CANSA
MELGDDAIRLRLFPFLLRDRAKSWLVSLPPNSINTWEGLALKFLFKFFPPTKVARLRSEINNFIQQDTSGRAFIKKSSIKAYELLDEMAMKNQQWSSERIQSKKVADMHEVDVIIKLTTQVEALTKMMTAQVKQAQVVCELCGGPHPYDTCQVNVNNLLVEQAQAIRILGIGDYSSID